MGSHIPYLMSTGTMRTAFVFPRSWKVLVQSRARLPIMALILVLRIADAVGKSYVQQES